MRQITLADVRPGMIGLSGGQSFIQRAIRWFTGSDWSHSFMIISGPLGELSAIETTDLKVRVASMQHKMAEPDWLQIWQILPGGDPDRERSDHLHAGLAMYLEYTDTWYGYLSYLWFMYRALMRKVGYEPRTIWRWAAGGVTCTELTCYYLDQLDRVRHVLTSRDLNTLAPAELLAIMHARPDLFKPVGWLKLPPAGITGEA